MPQLHSICRYCPGARGVLVDVSDDGRIEGKPGEPLGRAQEGLAVAEARIGEAEIRADVRCGELVVGDAILEGGGAVLRRAERAGDLLKIADREDDPAPGIRSSAKMLATRAAIRRH